MWVPSKMCKTCEKKVSHVKLCNKAGESAAMALMTMIQIDTTLTSLRPRKIEKSKM